MEQGHELFSGELFSSYKQLHVMSGECQELMPDTAFKGHVNGLCGGAVPGGLFLTVGIHTGDIPITVSLHKSAPVLDSSWEDIVETSCVFSEEPVYMFGWAGESSAELALPVDSYRARFCVIAFGQADESGEQAPVPERYLLQLWPAPVSHDVILKQTSVAAAYWHRVVQDGKA